MRSAYSATWRLFREHPEILTKGRYVRVPAGTPHYPGWHNLGSRDWTSDEREPWPPLGEAAGPRTYFTGQFEGDYPPAQLIGSAECLHQGERWPLAVVTELAQGFPVLCYADPPIPPPEEIAVLDLTDRAVMTQFAIILDLQYSNQVAATAALQAYLGPTAVITVVPNSTSIYPGTMIAVLPNFSVVVTSGTDTFQQLALQVLLSGAGPANYGTYGTSVLWFNASTVLHNRMVAAGVDFGKPVLLVGHSYGAALNAIEAVRLRQGTPDIDVRLLTYGMPKPGDIRFQLLLADIPGVHLANAGDPVPGVPPGRPLSFGLQAVFPLLPWDNWNLWRRPASFWRLGADGSLAPAGGDPLALPEAWTISTAVAGGLPIPVFTDHQVKEYRDRLLLSPP